MPAVPIISFEAECHALFTFIHIFQRFLFFHLFTFFTFTFSTFFTFTRITVECILGVGPKIYRITVMCSYSLVFVPCFVRIWGWAFLKIRPPWLGVLDEV